MQNVQLRVPIEGHLDLQFLSNRAHSAAGHCSSMYDLRMRHSRQDEKANLLARAPASEFDQLCRVDIRPIDLSALEMRPHLRHDALDRRDAKNPGSYGA
jgi:hypothetical protein